MPWYYEAYRPHTERYGAAYYGMLAGPPRDKQLRYEPPTDPRERRRSKFDTVSRGMRHGEESQPPVPYLRREASKVSASSRHRRPPPPAQQQTVPYAFQPINYGSRNHGFRTEQSYCHDLLDPRHVNGASRRSQPADYEQSTSRRSNQRRISSGYYSERANLSISSSMHVQVSRDSSVRPVRLSVNPAPQKRENTRADRYNELRQAARGFDRQEQDKRERWYDRGILGRLKRGER